MSKTAYINGIPYDTSQEGRLVLLREQDREIISGERHPWNENMQLFVRMLRGEITIPHNRESCKPCREAFERRYKFISSGVIESITL